MSVEAKPHTSPTPILPAVGEFDLLHETAGHPLIADLLRRAMGDDCPVDVDPTSSCTRSLLAHILEMLALRPGDLLVDLGCGRGGPGLWLARETGGPPRRARLLTKGNRSRNAHRRAFRACNACPVSRRIVRRDGASGCLGRRRCER